MKLFMPENENFIRYYVDVKTATQNETWSDKNGFSHNIITVFVVFFLHVSQGNIRSFGKFSTFGQLKKGNGVNSTNYN